MLHKSFAGALAGLLLVLSPSLSSLSAQAPGGSTRPGPDCISGRAAGAWDLPTPRGPGHARGLLLDIDGVRLAFEARLTPLPLPGNLRGGRVDGLLFPVTSAGRGPRPIAEVHGTYLIGADGRGRFETVVVAPDPAGGRPRQLGKFAGAFADPVKRGANPVGQFLGRWFLSR